MLAFEHNQMNFCIFYEHMFASDSHETNSYRTHHLLIILIYQFSTQRYKHAMNFLQNESDIVKPTIFIQWSCTFDE